MYLSRIYSDHMIFQRNEPICVEGRSIAPTRVTVSMAGFSADTVTAKDGQWRVELPPLEAGGPYDLTISYPEEEIVYHDILIGEVWFCGGQSNMQFPVYGDNEIFRIPGGDKIAAKAFDPELRLFHVPNVVSPFEEQTDTPAQTAWSIATPESVYPFSAIGYFFGQHLRKTLGVPVGLVSSNKGGSKLAPWLSRKILEKYQIQNINTALQSWMDVSGEKLHEKGFQALEEWHKKFLSFNPEASAEALKNFPALPEEAFSDTPEKNDFSIGSRGITWFCCRVKLDDFWAGKAIQFQAAFCNDLDEVFWDGIKIGGENFRTPNYWNKPRAYDLPENACSEGTHILAIRIQNHFGSGGMANPSLVLKNPGKARLLLSEHWVRRIEFHLPTSFPVRPNVPMQEENPEISFDYPTTLFNAMFAPFRPFRFRGFLWYQGCSDVGDDQTYAIAQKALVECWREETRSPNAAFLAVQLAGFTQQDPGIHADEKTFWKTEVAPQESAWADMRNVQAQLRELPNCGVVTAVDRGEPFDIHPKDKQTIADRLFAQAMRISYGATGNVTDGPYDPRATREGASVRVRFARNGEGLCLRDEQGQPLERCGDHAWMIADESGTWFWADAVLDGDSVLVTSSEVAQPTAVRYAWANYCPSTHLFNAAHYPAYPFSVKL